MRGITTGDWKLIEYVVNETRHTSLFNLKQDPFELFDLSSDSRWATKLAELRSELLCLRDQWEDCKHPHGVNFWNAFR